MADTETLIKDKKGAGKGLTWNEEMNMVLARAAVQVCTEPTVGVGKTSSDMGWRIKA